MLKRQEAKQNPNRQLSLPPRPKVEHGKLASTSIFDPQREIPGYKDDLTPKQKAAIKARYEEREKQVAMDKDKELSALRLDPDPLGRKTLERELVIKGIRRRGRLTKEQTLKRTERQMLYKSLQLATSTKKLTKLMNMIQGKTVEEALVQLRFNQKRIARDVYKGLLVAQDYAIAERGMGLDGLRKRGEHKTIQAAEGKLQNIARQAKSDPDHVEAHKAALEKAKEAREAAKLALIYPDGTRKLPNVGKPTNILLKDGSRKKVYDPSQIYIDQAWVGKDKTFKTHEFRARGRVNVLRNRTSSKFQSFLAHTDHIRSGSGEERR
jgi:ribosomal protein L22